MANNVVAHFRDGRVVKGISLDVDPMKPVCHVRPPGGKVEEILLADLKCLFFVKSLDGDPARDDSNEVDDSDPRARGSFPITVRFKDGEAIVGLTNRYPPNREFFFILPADTSSNNIRILVNRSAVVHLASES